MKLLLVEDDERIALALAEDLSDQNYVVDVANAGEAALELVEVFTYDLLLLDVTLPSLSGISLCKRLRSCKYKMPILLLGDREAVDETVQGLAVADDYVVKQTVQGLDAGADDYVVKPFDLQELAARIRAVMRRGISTLPPVLEWGALRLDPSSCEVNYVGQPVHLTPKEYCLLELFLRHGCRVFSRSAILEQLWDFDSPPEEETVKAHIKGLRQKLKLVGAPGDFIETVYGLGYRLKPNS